jgi:hypothetical protein
VASFRGEKKARKELTREKSAKEMILFACYVLQRKL